MAITSNRASTCVDKLTLGSTFKWFNNGRYLRASSPVRNAGRTGRAKRRKLLQLSRKEVSHVGSPYVRKGGNLLLGSGVLGRVYSPFSRKLRTRTTTEERTGFSSFLTVFDYHDPTKWEPSSVRGFRLLFTLPSGLPLQHASASNPCPSTWVEKFPMAAGSRQSPVNIETDRVESDHEALSSKPLRWKYPATASRKLVNPGYCWRIDTDGDGTQTSVDINKHSPLITAPTWGQHKYGWSNQAHPVIETSQERSSSCHKDPILIAVLSGGPLMDDIYKLEQYHCHWGCSDSRGSEHTVDGQAFAGELHLVHWNTSKYKTFAEAAKASDGLAVLGVFLKLLHKLQALEAESVTVATLTASVDRRLRKRLYGEGREPLFRSSKLQRNSLFHASTDIVNVIARPPDGI
uniref:Carbonic anhydrase n=1 Tax=Vespula pensylvanica TaxID=30213 RepID=A0A834JP53_VESPE|nr:hypothetical protein H0235_017442 [Vespula pensylvanica]